jgi:hypothetical protein
LVAFTAALAIYGSILAIYRSDIQTPQFTLEDLIQALQTAFEVLESLGGKTRQVYRCKKIIHSLLQVALALKTPVINAQRRDGRTNEAERLQLVTTNAGSDLVSEGLIRGLDSDIMLDLSSFTDNLGSLISDTFSL